MFEGCLSTLKETSLDDDNNEYLVKHDVKCINFDDYKEKYCKSIKASYFLKSVDAILIKEHNIYFFEFKNTKIDARNVYEIIEKCYDSMLMFFEKSKQGIKDSRQNFYFILVTNDGIDLNLVNSKNRIRKIVNKKANKVFNNFKKKFESNYFKYVDFRDPVAFDKFLINKNILT
jgi:hypothetical protein